LFGGWARAVRLEGLRRWTGPGHRREELDTHESLDEERNLRFVGMSWLFALLASGTTLASGVVFALSLLYRRSENPRVRAQGEAGPTAAGLFLVVAFILWGIWCLMRFS
jgi:hypothetical protein